MSSLQHVRSTISEANGDTAGITITSEKAWELYEKKNVNGMSLFLHTGDKSDIFIRGDSFEESAIRKSLYLEKGEYFSVISLPDSMNATDVFWFLINLGAPLTGKASFSGNVFHICSNSVSQLLLNIVRILLIEQKTYFFQQLHYSIEY